MEDNKKIKMEDDNKNQNGRRQKKSKWKTTKNQNGGQPKKMTKTKSKWKTTKINSKWKRTKKIKIKYNRKNLICKISKCNNNND